MPTAAVVLTLTELTLTADMIHAAATSWCYACLSITCAYSQGSLTLCVYGRANVYIPMRLRYKVRHLLENYHTHVRYVVCIYSMYV
jgi:hypothetical protein